MVHPQPDIRASVIISTHNRLRELDALLGDLMAQDFGDTFEVLVVDSDAAADSRPTVAERAGQGLRARHLLADNVLSSKRNRGADAASGDILVFLDDDMRVGQRFLEAHVTRVLAEPRSVVSGAVRFPHEWVSSSNYYRYKNSRHDNLRDGKDLQGNHFVAMNCAMRREDYFEIGGFEEAFKRYGGEDLDFGYRAVRQGYRLIGEPRAVAEHWEVNMNATRFARKIYAATYLGMPMVLDKNQEAQAAATVRFGFAGAQNTRIERAFGVAAGLMVKANLDKMLLNVVERADKRRNFYCPPLYMAITVLTTLRASKDLRDGQDPYLLRRTTGFSDNV